MERNSRLSSPTFSKDPQPHIRTDLSSFIRIVLEGGRVAELAPDRSEALSAFAFLQDFAKDKARWMPKDLYPFVMDFRGVMRFHISAKMTGRNALDVKDAAGKEFGREMLNLAKAKGNGWVDYEGMHPATKKVEDKTAVSQRVPGRDNRRPRLRVRRVS